MKTKAALIHHGDTESWLADGDKFTAVNRFDTIAKRKIGGIQRTTDTTASLEERGGLMGVYLQRLSELIGVPELSMYQSAAKVFRDYKGKNPEDTAHKFGESLTHLDFPGVKMKCVAVLKNTLKKLDEQLRDFRDNATSFKMMTGEHETVTLKPNEIKRNLLEFAQAKEELEHTLSEVRKSRGFGDLALALYEKVIYGVHGHHLHEEKLDEIVNPSASWISKLSAEEICDGYTATLLATQLLLRNQDKLTSNLLKDIAHSNLTKFDQNTMSPLNFWGSLLFSPFLAGMKGHLSAETTAELKKIAGRIVINRVRKIHNTLSGNSNLVQDWDLQAENARLITTRLNTRGQSINMVIIGIRNWDDIELSDKNTIIARVFYYLQRSAPNSPLLTRVRQLANTVLTMAAKDAKTIKDPVAGIQEQNFLLSLMREDQMGSTTASNAMNSNGNTTWSDMGNANAPDLDGSNDQQRGNKRKNRGQDLMIQKYNGRMVIKRARDFEKKKKFPRPGSEDQKKDNPEETPVQEDADIGAIGAGAVGGTIGGATTTADLGTHSGAIATYPKRLFGATGKKRKKRVIKRMIPSYGKLESLVGQFNEEMYSALLRWTDEDFTGNPQTDEGFKFLKKELNILPILVYEKAMDGWPIVKLTGSKQNLTKFLKEIYGADEKFINKNLTPTKKGE